MLSRYFTAGERRRLKLLALAAINATPLVGVLVLDWSLLALLMIYWMELGARLGFAALEGLFAEGKPEYDADGFSWLVIGALSEKRGRIPILGLPVSVQLANLPAIVMTLLVGSVVWLVLGGVGIGGVGETTRSTLSESASVSAGLGIIAVIGGRAVEAGGYFLTGEYESVSVQQPLRTALMSAVGTGSALFFGGSLVIAGAPSSYVLVAVFVVKLLADIVDVYRDRIEAFDERTSVELGFIRGISEWESIDTEFDDPSDTVSPNRLAILVGGAVRGARSPVVLLVGALLILVALFNVASNNGIPLELLGDGAVVAGMFVGFGVFDRTYRYLWMEYRIADDLVGYDRLFGPQWRLSSDQLAEAERVRTVTDRLFGTETVLVDYDDRTIRLPNVSPDALSQRER
jgi:hypothetical protein